MMRIVFFAAGLFVSPGHGALVAPESPARPPAAPLALAALAPPSFTLAPSLPLAGPLPVPAAPAALRAADGAEFTVVERRGRNGFGHELVLLDALDAREPAAGTAAHIDFTLKGGQASLDDPLDLSSTEKMAHPKGAPEGADLSHLAREHLWFGLAVKPEFQRLGLGTFLLDAAVARMRAAGAPTLFIRATESSRGFYLSHFGASVRSVVPETGGEGETLYRIEVDLSPR
jgi:GNAT superfamily N-acetyltransferase